MDFVIHNIPESVDRALRERAEANGVSADALALDVLGNALGLNKSSGLKSLPSGPPYHDLDWLFGSDPLEQSVLDAIAEADVVHPDDWR